MTTAFGTDWRADLERMALAVAYAIDNHPQCFLGTAILVEMARMHGLHLEPAAVSLLAQRRSTGAVVVSGHLAHRHFVNVTGAPAELVPIGAQVGDAAFDDAGHIVAIDRTRGLLLDPTFGQFTKAGMPDLVPVFPIDLSTTEWAHAAPQDVNILYLHAPTNAGWQAAYADASTSVLGVAADIRRHLAAGGEPHTHGHVFDTGDN
ncbi:hypothetical protein [Microbacterium gilvum]|uniref:Uncharacterized protein n=1 Tax=Microbacterium gilvum TaxID=1336204 RepID=A0ABP9ANR4_9MICO